MKHNKPEMTPVQKAYDDMRTRVRELDTYMDSLPAGAKYNFTMQKRKGVKEAMEILLRNVPEAYTPDILNVEWSATDIEIIDSIEAVENDDNEYVGYKLVTNLRTIELLIHGWTQCCEVHGYMTTEDDLDSFTTGDVALYKLEAIQDDGDYSVIPIDYDLEQAEQSLSAVFINLETSIGQLQFVLYNAHNGYYGHKVVIRISDSGEAGTTI